PPEGGGEGRAPSGRLARRSASMGPPPEGGGEARGRRRRFRGRVPQWGRLPKEAERTGAATGCNEKRSFNGAASRRRRRGICLLARLLGPLASFNGAASRRRRRGSRSTATWPASTLQW